MDSLVHIDVSNKQQAYW